MEALATTRRAASGVLKSMMSSPADAYAVSIPFLKLCGFSLGGWLLAKSAAIAERKLASGAADQQFLAGKIASARFYFGSHPAANAGTRARRGRRRRQRGRN